MHDPRLLVGDPPFEDIGYNIICLHVSALSQMIKECIEHVAVSVTVALISCGRHARYEIADVFTPLINRLRIVNPQCRILAERLAQSRIFIRNAEGEEPNALLRQLRVQEALTGFRRRSRLFGFVAHVWITSESGVPLPGSLCPRGRRGSRR